MDEIIKEKTKKVQNLPDTVRLKKRYFRVQNTMVGVRETECTAQDAMEDGKIREGYLYKEEWQHWKTTVNSDGVFSGGWKELVLDDVEVEHHKPEKRKIQWKRIGNQIRYYIYVPWIYEVTKSEDKDPFLDALSSYQFKSIDENERMEILLGTPYEGMVSTRNGETKTCIPWVSNKVVLKPSLERKVIYKHGQVIAEAAEMINIHESQCQMLDEEVLTDTFDQYANLHHQKTKMMNPQLQDVLLDQTFADHFKYCCKYSLLKEAHDMQLQTDGYKMQDFPRELADKGYMDQINHQNKKKRRREDEIPRNEPNVRPKVIPLNFNN